MADQKVTPWEQRYGLVAPSGNFWESPAFNLGMGMLAGNYGRSKGEAFSNAIRGGMGGLQQARAAARDAQNRKINKQRMIAEQARLARQKKMQQALGAPGQLMGPPTRQGLLNQEPGTGVYSGNPAMAQQSLLQASQYSDNPVGNALAIQRAYQPQQQAPMIEPFKISTPDGEKIEKRISFDGGRNWNTLSRGGRWNPNPTMSVTMPSLPQAPSKQGLATAGAMVEGIAPDKYDDLSDDGKKIVQSVADTMVTAEQARDRTQRRPGGVRNRQQIIKDLLADPNSALSIELNSEENTGPFHLSKWDEPKDYGLLRLFGAGAEEVDESQVPPGVR